MLSIAMIREYRETVERELARKGYTEGLDKIVELDEEMRETLTEFETKRAYQKQLSKKVGMAKAKGEDPSELFAEGKTLAQTVKDFEAKTERLRSELTRAMLHVPNLPDEDVPNGADESENMLVSEHGALREFAFKPLAHWDLLRKGNMLDGGTGAKLSGSGFNCLRNDLAKLERALIDYMIDIHVAEHGYEEISTPFIAREDSMKGTGQLPKFHDDMYKLEDTDLYLIPTAEVTLANCYRDTIFGSEELPRKICGYTPCFRKEAGAAGRDTRGLIRVHQFSKVELINFTTPDKSDEQLQTMISEATKILDRLQLPYRLMLLCTGDMTFSSARTIDIEAYCPGVERWLEISSCSNCRDFQARRMKTRFKDEDNRNQLVHILNGSGLALPRLLVAIAENYQQEDGLVRIPQVLKKYFPGKDFLG
ncbi:MAG: serine--tRNA ligase [Planctomycetota bacterium]|nr:serine--tRNA ligase [Planctomycetota bacterium]